jgi:hypothetical protein
MRKAVMASMGNVSSMSQIALLLVAFGMVEVTVVRQPSALLVAVVPTYLQQRLCPALQSNRHWHPQLHPLQTWFGQLCRQGCRPCSPLMGLVPSIPQHSQHQHRPCSPLIGLVPSIPQHSQHQHRPCSPLIGLVPSIPQHSQHQQ